MPSLPSQKTHIIVAVLLARKKYFQIAHRSSEWEQNREYIGNVDT